MTIDDLQQYWALLIASVLGLGIVLFVLLRASQDSRRGRLGSALTYLRDRERAAQVAAKAVAKATTKMERLRAKASGIADRPPANLLARVASDIQPISFTVGSLATANTC